MGIHGYFAPNTTSAFDNPLRKHLYILFGKRILFRNIHVRRTNKLIGSMVAGFAITAVYQQLSFVNLGFKVYFLPAMG
jgi:hypothetical protein